MFVVTRLRVPEADAAGFAAAVEAGHGTTPLGRHVFWRASR